MAAILHAQKNCYHRVNIINGIVAGYEIAQLNAQHGRPFRNGEFIKQCLTKVAVMMCPKKLYNFNNVSMARNTAVRRIEGLSSHMKHQVSQKACVFNFYSIGCDESTGATDSV